VLLIIALVLIATLTGTKTRIRRRRDYPLDGESDSTVDEETEQDDASNNEDEVDNKPTEENTVDEIQGWLDDHNVDYTTRMRKAELLDLVKEHDE
jgi:hypothetical protein